MKQSEIVLLRGVFGNIYDRIEAVELSNTSIAGSLSSLQAQIAALPPTLTQPEVETIISDWIATEFPTFGPLDVPDYQP
jgi:hypothetical protein